jgi:hypothetical protein
MLSPLVLAENRPEDGAPQHWLRLAVPPECLAFTGEDCERLPLLERVERAVPIYRDLRHFLKAYAAALLAAVTFIA